MVVWGISAPCKRMIYLPDATRSNKQHVGEALLWALEHHLGGKMTPEIHNVRAPCLVGSVVVTCV